jgi:sarcosine oxidase
VSASTSSFDVVVIGAGVFGAWTAWHLAKRRQRVLLVEAHSPAHSRASSGGESRIIRMSYGSDEIYTRWSLNSLGQWRALFHAQHDNLFHQTGVLWLAGQDVSTLEASSKTLQRCEVNHEVMQHDQLVRRYPQVNFDSVPQALFEPGSGILLARRAVNKVVQDAQNHGVQFRVAQIEEPHLDSPKLESIRALSGETIQSGQFVFACGPWLGKLFPEILGPRIFPTRQEVFFFATPPNDTRFAPPALPTWLFQADEVYGMPDLEGRGLKIARDTHGERVDPDTQSRLVSSQGMEWARDFVARRFPSLKGAPIVETRVCQYENTSNGDFLIDRHPDFSNVWFAGGGSGHGFKHGPAVGDYTARLLLGEIAPEPRFSLATKATEQKRTVH